METRKKSPEKITPGSIVEAKCGKCKDVTRHIVIAMLGGKPSKVECKPCHATHAYRAPDKPGAAPRAAGTRTRTRSASAAPAQSAEEAWAHAMRKANGPAVKYSMSALYELGQRLAHPTFGEGVISSVVSPTVIAVTFKSGPVKLVMGK